jgi:antitoxin component of MazEF toxin-antitoxin module
MSASGETALPFASPRKRSRQPAFKTDGRVKVSEEDGRIVIEKAETPEAITLKWLLEGMAPGHLHVEVDFGPPVGKEFR